MSWAVEHGRISIGKFLHWWSLRIIPLWLVLSTHVKNWFGCDQVHVLSPMVTMNRRDAVHIFPPAVYLLGFSRCAVGCRNDCCLLISLVPRRFFWWHLVLEWSVTGQPLPTHISHSFETIFYSLRKTDCCPNWRVLTYPTVPHREAIPCVWSSNSAGQTERQQNRHRWYQAIETKMTDERWKKASR